MVTEIVLKRFNNAIASRDDDNIIEFIKDSESGLYDGKTLMMKK